MKHFKSTIYVIAAFVSILVGLGYDSRINFDIAQASYSPLLDSPFMVALSALPSMNDSMIHVNALGALSQTTAYDFGVSLIGSVDAAAARTLLGVSAAGFTGAFADLTGKPTTLSGYGITDDTSNARSAVSLTTTGTSGSATYNSSTGVFNIPQYPAGTITSIIAGTGLSGGTITSTGTISLPSTGTAGTYSGVTTDAQGRVTAGTNRSWNNSPGRSIVTGTGATGFQPSSTRDTRVSYGVKVTSTASIASGQEGYVTLEIAATNSATAGDWVAIGAVCGNGQTYSLAIALQGIQPTYCEVSATVPAGWYAKLRSVNVTGTPSYTYIGGQEMAF